MWGSRQAKMRTALICLLIFSFTLSGNNIFNVVFPPVKPKSAVEIATQELKKVEYQNLLKLNMIEQNMNKYELSKKDMEQDSLR